MATPITQLPGVGDKMAEKLLRIQVQNIEDLLFHLPLRYQDRTRIYPIAELPLRRETLFEGVVEYAQIRYGRRRFLSVRVRDRSAAIELKFFHFSNAQKSMFREGRKLRCFGTVFWGRNGREMIHPECQWLNSERELKSPAYVPIYPVTEGISQFSMRRLINAALHKMQRGELELEELLPQEMAKMLPREITVKKAIHYIHCPPKNAQIEQLLERRHPVQQRLAFEEMLAHTTALRHLRQTSKRDRATALLRPEALYEQFKQNLSFNLTRAQARVIEEIFQDLRCAVPMIRLVQGDVGSGKTVVAAAAILAAVQKQKQSAFMVPTETLAQQHYHNLKAWFEPLNIHVCLLTGQQKVAHTRNVQRQIRTGEADVIVGTHALFQTKIEFANLALLIIDEQHRFGVHQRLALKQKGENEDTCPHQLIMTATPIPRSLAMTLYADLDYSVIDQLPPGRIPAKTTAIPQSRRHEVIARIGNFCAQGQQVYWVCPVIEESDKQQFQAAEKILQLLSKALVDLRLGLIHGRMKREEKEAVLLKFRQKKLQILVATTVIEVGVDIPTANLIVIENAERFGLAQLHQLRGRVGRGGKQGFCILLHDTFLSDVARQRLDILRRSNDGFEIAQKDMQIRGPGEVFGIRQTGAIHFRIANLAESLVEPQKMCQLADQLLRQQPAKAAKLIQRWFGGMTQYADT